MSKATNNRQLLIVDDNRFARTVLNRILTAANSYDVNQAASGEEALEIISKQPGKFDAFLIDIEMPGMDGMELSRKIRRFPEHRLTPILMVTALDEGKELRECFSVGADDFVNKPLDPVIVHARLSGLLQRVDYYNQLEKLRRSLVRYVSPRTQLMVEKYFDSETLPPPEEQNLCVMFSDIRGFTALSQKIEPDVLFANVSHHLGTQVDVVYQYGGYVDKFGGDGIMAVFEGEDGPINACNCALEIMEIAKISPPVNEKPVMPVGIGIHKGAAMVGNIGGGEHLDYSVIGNTVNLAARLCGYAGPMDIIVSEAVKAAASATPHLKFSNGQEAEIRGLSELITLYNLVKHPSY